MTYFDIHTHAIPEHPSQTIVSVNVNDLPIAKDVQFVSIGIHPWYLTEENAEYQWKTLKKSVNEPQIRAIGEAGLDKLRGASIKFQTSFFQEEIALSETYHLPMVIHCVRAFNELIQIKKECKPKQPWIIHGFRGKPSIAQELLKHGCWLSFGSNYQEESIRVTPLNRLFIETDESEESIENIYQRIAHTRGISLEELTEGVKKNVQEVFFKG